DVTFDLRGNEMKVHHNAAEPWHVTLVDTGTDTNTGGRLARVRKHLDSDSFCFTYGDGVGNVDIPALLSFHQSSRARTTLTAVRPPARYGAVELTGDRVAAFHEKPLGAGGWISGGVLVVEPSALDLVQGDASSWENDVLPLMAERGELAAYVHPGFWHAMDTLRDKQMLESLWTSRNAKWKVWS